MSKSCSRGPRHCRNAATRKRKLKTDQVYLYLPSIKGGIIFSQVLAMEHLPGILRKRQISRLDIF